MRDKIAAMHERDDLKSINADLLAALEGLLKLLDTTEGLATYKQARAAIAKARGEED